MSRLRILIADDDADVRFGIREFLVHRGYEVEEVGTCADALEAFRSRRLDAALLDYSMPDGNTIELLPRLRAAAPDVPIIMLTGYATIERAVQAILEGADQFLTKPTELAGLAAMLERVIESRRASQRDLAGRRREARLAQDPFVGASAAIRALAEDARRIASADSPLLIQGETGSGKGVLAAWIHAQGPRGNEAFVDLNCAGLSKEFLETELFGHERGAFTGAVAAKQGLLDIAHRGTVFLDEMGDMDLTVQAKILKVVEDQRFRRLGDVRDRQVDVRIIAATHKELRELVARQAFRSDLYFRISTLPLRVPPLRERPEDIEPIALGLISRIGGELGRRELDLAADALEALRLWSWPGNIRELRNVLERAVLLCDGRLVTRRDLRFDGSLDPKPETEPSYAGTLDEIERRAIEAALHEQGGNVAQTARRLGLSRSSLYAKLRSYAPTREH